MHHSIFDSNKLTRAEQYYEDSGRAKQGREHDDTATEEGCKIFWSIIIDDSVCNMSPIR